jgi:hypothetical protein
VASVGPRARAEKAADLDGFLRRRLWCGAVFYEVEPDATVRALPRTLVRARIGRGWRSASS